MKEDKITFTSPAGKLAGVLHHPLGSCRGCIITSHGLFSSKDSDKFLSLGNYFAQKGFFVFRFDFRGCGESEGFMEDTTISGRKEDLTAALSFIQKTIPLHAHTVGLLGSSMGGYISLLVAPDCAVVKAVVTWATPFTFSGLRSVITESSQVQLTEHFYQDMNSYEATSFVPRVKNLLVIHGDSDETVPPAHAQELYQLAQEPKQLTIVPGADHTFSNPQLRKQATTESLNWFKRCLNP